MQHRHITFDEPWMPITMPFIEDLEESPYNTDTVAVIGAGIAGLTAAYSLATRGCKVEIIEREPYPAMGTSYANGGQWSVSNSDAWTTWHNVGLGLKWLLKPDAPLLVRPSPSIGKMVWLARFLWETASGSHSKNTARTIELALEARKLYLDIAEREGILFDHKQNGILHIYKDHSRYQDAIARCDFYQRFGVSRIPISTKAMLDIEPTLVDAPGIVGATHTPDDSMGDIHQFCRELARVLQIKYGVVIKYNHMVTQLCNYDGNVLVQIWDGIKEKAARYSDVVIAAGSDSNRFARLVDDFIGVYPVKGYSITIPVSDASLLPRTSLLDENAKIVTSSLGDRLRVAGTAELDGHNRDIRRSRIAPLERWVRTNLPHIGTEHAVPWAGLRPMTPSMMPVVRQSKNMSRVWWHAGHGHLGWTLCAATAEILARQIETVRNL